MARTIIAHGPSGLSSPTLRTVNPTTDVIEATTTLTEDTNAKGRYTGDLDEVGQVVSAGTYVALLRSGSSVIGTFEAVTIAGGDPETVTVRDTVEAEATVNAASVGAAVWSALTSSYATVGTFGAALQAAVAYTVPNTNLITLIRDNSYDGTGNAKLGWTVAKDFTGGSWSGTFTVRHRETNDVLVTKTVTVVDATNLSVTLLTADTAFSTITENEDWGLHPYEVQMTDGTAVMSVVQGQALCKPDYTS